MHNEFVSRLKLYFGGCNVTNKKPLSHQLDNAAMACWIITLLWSTRSLRARMLFMKSEDTRSGQQQREQESESSNRVYSMVVLRRFHPFLANSLEHIEQSVKSTWQSPQSVQWTKMSFQAGRTRSLVVKRAKLPTGAGLTSKGSKFQPSLRSQRRFWLRCLTAASRTHHVVSPPARNCSW